MVFTVFMGDVAVLLKEGRLGWRYSVKSRNMHGPNR
jgi:hypothetical protein